MGGGGGSPAPPPATPPPLSAEEVQKRRFGGEGEPSITAPSLPLGLRTNPEGRLTMWEVNDDDATVRGIRRENESALLLAQQGYDVEQNPHFPYGKKPDFRIEGKIFDNFAPDESTSARNIHSTVRDKVEDDQTRRVIINLDDSQRTPDQLQEQFSAWPIPGLEEVKAIKAGKIYQIFPLAD